MQLSKKIVHPFLRITRYGKALLALFYRYNKSRAAQTDLLHMWRSLMSGYTMGMAK